MPESMKLIPVARRGFADQYRRVAVAGDNVFVAGGRSPPAGRRSEYARLLMCMLASSDLSDALWQSCDTRSKAYECMATDGVSVALTVPYNFPGQPSGVYVVSARDGAIRYSMTHLGVADACGVSNGRVVASYASNGTAGLLSTIQPNDIRMVPFAEAFAQVTSIHCINGDCVISRTIDAGGNRSLHTRVSSDLSKTIWEVESRHRYSCIAGSCVVLYSNSPAASGHEVVSSANGALLRASRGTRFSALRAISDRLLMSHSGPNQCEIISVDGDLLLSFDRPKGSDFVDFAGYGSAEVFVLASGNALVGGSTLMRFEVKA